MENRKPILILLASLFFFLSDDTALLISHGQPLPIVDDQGANGTQIRTYIVHVLRPKGAAEFLSAEERENWHRSFLPSNTLDSGEPRLVYSYEHVISGFAARLSPEEMKAVEAMDGFLLAYPDQPNALRTTHTPAFLELDKYNGLWYSSSYGAGSIIGVVDSGIAPTHPSFSDDGMPPPPKKWRGHCDFGASACNNKVIGAMAFRGGLHPSPLDTQGHGTHTASTAAGNYVYDAGVLGQAKGTAVGIAPKAHLAVYKTCCGGYRGSDTLAAIEQAIKDGVDVLSISLGKTAVPFYRDPIAIGAFAAMEKEVLISTSAGNSGPSPSSIENDAPWFLTVGASSTDRRIRATVRLGNGMELDGESGYQPDNFSSTMLPLVNPGDLQTVQAISCQKGSLDTIDVKGKIVLCESGIIESTEKAEVVKAAGGAAVIILNQPTEGFTITAHPYTFPAAQVSFDDAWKIVIYLTTTKNPTATILFKGTQFGARPSPAVASLSSRGPSLLNGGVLKPDIIAPGVNVLAAWPKEVGPNPTGTSKTFFLGTGTSMAAPHLAGVAAMLKKNHPQWSPAAIKSAVMTTAHHLDRDKKPIADEGSDYYKPDRGNIFATGAGHVNPSQADDPGLIYDIQPDDYIDYLCGLGYTDRQVSVVAKRLINCSGYQKISAEELNYPAIVVSLGSTSTKYINRTVRNVGVANSAYTVKVLDEPKGVKVVVLPDNLQFSALDEEKTFTIQLSLSGAAPSKGEVLQGQLVWGFNQYSVRTPIAVTS